MKRINVFSIVLAILLFASIAVAEVPQMINYQGRLTDPAGEPVGDAIYSIHFQIYDAATDGAMLWTSFGYVPIEVTEGLFSHLLGSTNPLPDSLVKYDALWLGITIAPDTEIDPRTLLASVPYALRAAFTDSAYNALHAQAAVYADTASYATLAETVLRSRNLYHQILDINPNSTTTIPFVVWGSSATVVLYVYGSAYQGTLAQHTHAGNNPHSHGVSGSIGSTSVPHTHSFSGNTSSGGSSHTHSGTTSLYNLSHRHSGTTNNDGAHHHDFLFQGLNSGLFLVRNNDPVALTAHGTYNKVASGSVATTRSEHQHGFTTSYEYVNHSHTFTTGNASSSHSHSFSGNTGSNSISHNHSFSGSVSSTGSGLEESGIPYGTFPSTVYVYVDGTLAAGPFSGEFSSGELDISAYIVGSGEHNVEISEEGGNGGRITYNLFVE